MSFSRAKRFVEKTPDINCSPADYLISEDLNKGCRMSQSPRFQKPKIDDEKPQPCSRLFHTYCSESKDDSTLKEKPEHFHRNSPLRSTINTCRRSDMAKKPSTAKKPQEDPMDTINLHHSEEFIDDDYENLTSIEEIQHLNELERYEIFEIHKKIKRIQNRKWDAPSQNSNFQDTVLRRLDVIHENVKTIKDVLPLTSNLKPIKESAEDENIDLTQMSSSKSNRQMIRDIIKEALEKLHRNFENKRKAILRDNEKQIISTIAKIYAANNRSSEQIKEMCNATAEELVRNLTGILRNSVDEHECKQEIENILKQFKNNYLSDTRSGNLSSDALQNVKVTHLEKPREGSEELEDDISDITLKCMDTQQMLNIQRVLLDEMKSEISNLKSSLF